MSTTTAAPTPVTAESAAPALDPGRAERAAYTVVGAGAIGGTLAHALAGAGHAVTVIDTDAAHVAAIREHGLTIRRPDGRDDVVRVAGAYLPDEAPETTVDRVVLATKSQHTATAAAWVAPRLAADGLVLSAQNGHNEQTIADAVGAHRVLGAFVNIFTDYLGPGVVSDGGAGAVAVGLPDGGAPDARVLAVAEDLRAYGDVVATANLAGYRWGKQGFGSILGLTTLVDAPIADVVDLYRDLAAAVARESTEVAIRSGVVLERFDAYEPYAFSDAAPALARERALTRLVRWLRTQPKDRSGVFRDIAVRRRPRETGGDRSAYPEQAAAVGVELVVGPLVARALDEVAAGTRDFGWHTLDEIRAEVAARA